MKTYLKFSIGVSAVMCLTGSVNATQSLYITDGDSIGGAVDLVSNNSGAVSETFANVDGWSILVANGTASPPVGGGGTAQSPLLDLTITANYNGSGGAGSTLDIYFGSDGFGPTSSSFVAGLTGNVIGGTTGLGVIYSTWDISGSALPSVANPIPTGASTLVNLGTVNPSGGSYNSTMDGGSFNLASYSLGEHITLTGSSAGSGYTIGASLAAVPEPSVMTLAIVGAGALGMIRRRRSA